MSLLYALAAWICNFRQKVQSRKPITEKSPIVMVTGGKMAKSLHFARWFWKSGYKVVMVETEKYWLAGSRWSRAVTWFDTVPCPRNNPKGYIDGLVKVAEIYKVDF